jgi:hypothetical protein
LENAIKVVTKHYGSAKISPGGGILAAMLNSKLLDEQKEAFVTVMITETNRLKLDKALEREEAQKEAKKKAQKTADVVGAVSGGGGGGGIGGGGSGGGGSGGGGSGGDDGGGGEGEVDDEDSIGDMWGVLPNNMDSDLPAQSFVKVWQRIQAMPSTSEAVSEYLKLAELVATIPIGSVADERLFSTLSFCKNKIRNRLKNDHLNIVVRGFQQQIYSFATFPLRKAVEDWLVSCERGRYGL